MASSKAGHLIEELYPGGFESEKQSHTVGVRECSRPRVSEPFQTLLLSPQTLGAMVPAVATESDVEVCLFWPTSLHSVHYKGKLTCEGTLWNLMGYYLAGNVGVIFKCGVWFNRSSQQPWMSSNGAQNIYNNFQLRGYGESHTKYFQVLERFDQ